MGDVIITRAYGYGEDELYHFGIKGQRWGVRRYENEDGTLTPAGKERYRKAFESQKGSVDRAFQKQKRKLDKLAERTDIAKQQQNISKYNKRAAIGASVAVGAAGVAAGAKKAHDMITDNYIGSVNRFWNLKERANKIATDTADANVASLLDAYKRRIKAWGVEQPGDEAHFVGEALAEYDEASKRMQRNEDDYQQQRKTESWKAAERHYAADVGKTVAIGVAAVSAGYAAYNKVQAHLAQRRTTEIGHSKAVAKYRKQVNKMVDMFADTPYADLVKKSA